MSNGMFSVLKELTSDIELNDAHASANALLIPIVDVVSARCLFNTLNGSFCIWNNCSGIQFFIGEDSKVLTFIRGNSVFLTVSALGSQTVTSSISDLGTGEGDCINDGQHDADNISEQIKVSY